MVVDLVFLGDVVLGLTLRASEIDDVSFTFFSHSVDYIRLVKWSWEREADASHPIPTSSGLNPRLALATHCNLEPMVRFELTTHALRKRCSTS